MAEQLKKRSEVPVELTWDLTALYKSDEEMFAALDEAKKLCDSIVAKYQGKLNTAEAINACYKDYEDWLKIVVIVSHYADLGASVDYTDSALQELNGRVMTELTAMESRLSFIESEVLQQSEDVIKKAIDEAAGAKNTLKDLLRMKPHMLAPEAERVMKAMGQTIQTPYEIYNVTKLADMQFPDFTVDGRVYPLGYSLYEDDYEYETDTKVRRAAFEAFSKKLKEYENVTATAYNACVRQEKIEADLRGYDSVFDSLLFNQHVTREMYDRQIDLITTKLAPHMRKYAKLIQKTYGMDKMTFCDLKLPLDAEYSPRVTIDGSREYIEKGLAVMGEDYVEMIRTAYKDRWVDFAQNVGKSTGGFCASPYGNHSYILLSWNERMSDVFTLAHELGHAGHFKRCNSKQSLFDTDVSTYMVEAPSTMNELLMAHYLLKTSDDKRFQRWVLSSMIQNTYYHNFVTHLLEADYQRKVYRIIDEGGSVSAEVLNRLMRETLENFWGDAVEITEGAELTWMRQPHYYMGLYSYTYSAGLTVATEVCKRIENEGQAAVDDWKKVLDAGSTLDPVGLAALARVDITTDTPLLDTIDTIGGIIDDIEKLTNELE